MAAEKGTRLETGHVGINVTNLERSKEFYRKVFPFQVTAESKEGQKRFALLGDGERLVLTLWEQSRGRFEAQKPGLHHLSFQASGIEAVKELEKKLRELKVPLIYDGIVAHGEGAEAGGVYFEDPDGIRLEVYSPTGAKEYSAATPGVPSCGFF